MCLHCGPQVLTRRCLDSKIQTQAQLTAVMDLANAFDITDHSMPGINEHPLVTLDTGQMAVECPLYTFLPPVIDIGESDDMPGNWAGRVVTPVLTLRRHAANTKLLNTIRFLRG